MQVTFSDTRRETTIILPPIREMVPTEGGKDLLSVRFSMKYPSIRDDRSFEPFLARDNVEVIVTGQPPDAVAVKCIFFDDEGTAMGGENSLMEGSFDAGTTVINPIDARGMICDAYYYEASPNDIQINFGNPALKMHLN